MPWFNKMPNMSSFFDEFVFGSYAGYIIYLQYIYTIENQYTIKQHDSDRMHQQPQQPQSDEASSSWNRRNYI